MNEWMNGMPVMGELVEYVENEFPDRGFVGKAEFVSFYKGIYILAHEDLSGGVAACEIRPINRLEEDVEYISKFLELHDDMDSLSIARELVQAGYRKVSDLSDEEIKKTKSRHMSDAAQDGFNDGAKWARAKILGANHDHN